MKDYKIYIFTVTGYSLEDSTIAQVYAKDFCYARYTMVALFPNYEEIDFIGFEETTDPECWGEYTNAIALTN